MNPAQAFSRLRVAIATAQRQVIGGTEQYLAALIPELAGAGCAVGLLYERDAEASAPAVDAGTALAWCADAGPNPTDSLRRLAEWRPSVVYVHGLLSPSLEAKILARFPAALYAHSYYGTCATGNKRHAFPGLKMCSRTLGPACLPLNYLRRCGGLEPVGLLARFRLQERRRALLGRYQAVLVGSRHMQREFAAHGVGPERLHLVPLPSTGVVPDPPPPAARPPGGSLLYMGRLTSVKGGDLLIRAIPKANALLGRQLRLTVAGLGPEVGRWRALAARLGVDAAFVGWVDAPRRLELLRSADLLAVPSVWPEPFALVGPEAGCVGLPAVAYAVGGIEDWLTAGATGELASGDPPTSDGLAAAIVRALQDDGHYALLRQGAWEMSQRFTMERHLEKLAPVLESCAS